MTNKRIKKISLVVFLGVIIAAGFWLYSENNKAEAESYKIKEINLDYAIIEGNSFLPVSPLPQIQTEVIGQIKVLTTAYSSTVWETDDTPFLTASGSYVKDGIVANNLLPFGTKIRIPEVYGDKIFVVEDRMHWSKSPYYVDIWFPSNQEAKNYGVKTTYIEILREI